MRVVNQSKQEVENVISKSECYNTTDTYSHIQVVGRSVVEQVLYHVI